MAQQASSAEATVTPTLKGKQGVRTERAHQMSAKCWSVPDDSVSIELWWTTMTRGRLRSDVSGAATSQEPHEQALGNNTNTLWQELSGSAPQRTPRSQWRTSRR